MTVSIEQSTLSPEDIIRKCHEFTDDRPLLQMINTGPKIRELVTREFVELHEALTKPPVIEDQWIAEIAEELPDVLIFIIQHWINEHKSQTEIVEFLYQAEVYASLLPEFSAAFYLPLFERLTPLLDEEKPLDDAISVYTLALCFGLSRSLDFDLYELADVKSDHNDKRYQKELYQIDGAEQRTYDELLAIYKQSRTATKKYASENMPKEVHLYPKLLELRRTRE